MAGGLCGSQCRFRGRKHFVNLEAQTLWPGQHYVDLEVKIGHFRSRIEMFVASVATPHAGDRLVSGMRTAVPGKFNI